jgi:hypothetical protein
MRKSNREKSTMSCVEFCQQAARERIAPPSLGSAKVRIAYFARKMKLSNTRARDIWYANPRVSIKADELRAIEEKAGINYGREEAHELDQQIARATALLVELQKDSPRSLAHALVEAARILAGARA